MKKGILFALLVLTPLFTFSANDRNNEVYGLWEDYRTGLSIQIKPGKRRSIMVKRIDGRHRARWVKYDRLRRGHYDDCDGNSIRLTRRGLKWSKKYGRRTFYLERSYQDHNRRGYNRRERDYNYGRDYGNRRGTNRYDSYDLSGNWHCDVHNVDIDISYYNDGIRVRRYNNRRRGYDDWYNYKRDVKNRNRYFGADSKYYEIHGDQITFHDSRRGKKLKFKKKRRR